MRLPRKTTASSNLHPHPLLKFRPYNNNRSRSSRNLATKGTSHSSQLSALATLCFCTLLDARHRYLPVSSSDLNGRGSPSVAPNAVQYNSTQPRQPRGTSPNNGASNANGSAQPSPSTAQSSPQPQMQAQQQTQSGQPPQQRTAYPWAQRRLLLPPPVILPKPGVQPPTTPSPSPFPRYGPALPATATATGELFLFGGLVREQVRNDLYLFSTTALSATLLQTAGEIPSPRVGHASALVGSVLIVWGGDTKSTKARPGDKQDDGLYLLNLGVCSMLYDTFCVRSLI